MSKAKCSTWWLWHIYLTIYRSVLSRNDEANAVAILWKKHFFYKNKQLKRQPIALIAIINLISLKVSLHSGAASWLQFT